MIIEETLQTMQDLSLEKSSSENKYEMKHLIH